MKSLTLILMAFIASVSAMSESRVDSLRNAIFSPAPFDRPMVIAHRGDWRNGTENSLRAIEGTISMGCDMVELDIAMTRDSVLVLMHDDTVDRTTTGSGKVSDLTLEEIKSLRLLSPIGVVTRQQVPTFKEALALCKGKVLVQVDKWPTVKDLVIKEASEAGCLDHIVLRSSHSSKVLARRFGEFPEEIIYISVLVCKGDGDNERLDDFIANIKTPVMSFSFKNAGAEVLGRIPELKKKGYHIWLNSLWDTFSGGYDDELAYDDPQKAYGWLIDCGADMIFTDHPSLLLDYIKQ